MPAASSANMHLSGYVRLYLNASVWFSPRYGLRFADRQAAQDDCVVKHGTKHTILRQKLNILGVRTDLLELSSFELVVHSSRWSNMNEIYPERRYVSFDEDFNVENVKKDHCWIFWN
ncbi:hypothetical protein ARMGADRAFT_1036002 [Armillaria gallica]|uniref:Uncharacterized protein n=1 Tax=Armillaria gallica TaxID=47427 RepID=A0A2H3CS03_ARMGA|nr:hypothetical protein ARMGADRAFT_1036002 [Armillaria gallica]